MTLFEVSDDAAVSVLCVCPSNDEAARIARVLLESRLIACAHVLPAGHSQYWWQGKIEQADEHYAFFKTTKSLYPTVEREIVRLHSHEVPCILAYPVAAGFAPYLAWLRAQTSGVR